MTRELRLGQLLDEHFKRLKGWVALEREVAQAHAEALEARGVALGEIPKRPIDRRKLQNIAEGKDVSIYISELEALDDFLSLFHQGLAYVPIFVRPTLLSALVAREKVHCLVGSREVDNTVCNSNFDTEAYSAVERHLNSQGPRVTSEFASLLLRATRDDARRFQDEIWERVRDEKAVVAIASPIANHGTDLILAQMFGCLPCQPPGTTRPDPEIAFILPDPFLSDAFSSFVEGPDQLRRLDPSKAAEIRERRWALRVGTDVFVADPEDQPLSKTYGVIVAQRRANGHIWVVAAGLHGAGTYAAALALPDARISLSSGRQDQDGPVHVCVVEARVTYTISPTGNKIRKVVEQRILTQFNRSFDTRAPRQTPRPQMGSGPGPF
ncbi:MAG: hypothetical protein HOP15_17435 [Planctomycetes bacterium]|nr:hypothetical protein [Planctomycetota bacterium]